MNAGGPPALEYRQMARLPQSAECPVWETAANGKKVGLSKTPTDGTK